MFVTTGVALSNTVVSYLELAMIFIGIDNLLGDRLDRPLGGHLAAKRGVPPICFAAPCYPDTCDTSICDSHDCVRISLVEEGSLVTTGHFGDDVVAQASCGSTFDLAQQGVDFSHVTIVNE